MSDTAGQPAQAPAIGRRIRITSKRDPQVIYVVDGPAQYAPAYGRFFIPVHVEGRPRATGTAWVDEVVLAD